MCISKRMRRQTGLTIIELLVFIVIMSIAVLALLRVWALVVNRSPDVQQRKQALALAEGFLEEVSSARFTFCDPFLDAQADDPLARPNPAACSVQEDVKPEAGNSRPFDNVNDYVTQFNTATAAFNSGANLVDAAGNALIDLPGYSVSLKITPENLNGITSGSTPATMEVLKISVTVSYNGGADSITLDGYRTRYAPWATP
ncbi:type II secretion system protein [Massilia sp. W12]|uniref:type II secretion system protein n=1 Tax=Massilia sp. W12 TaxID=3126507 RepID=UPI0030D2E4F8